MPAIMSYHIISYHLLRRPSSSSVAQGHHSIQLVQKQSNKMKFKNAIKTRVHRRCKRFINNLKTYKMLLK